RRRRTVELPGGAAGWLAAGNAAVAAVWHSRRARFVVQLTATQNGGKEMETFLDRTAKNARTQVTKMRWALGLHGLASVVFGVMVLAWPGTSAHPLPILF